MRTKVGIESDNLFVGDFVARDADADRMPVMIVTIVLGRAVGVVVFSCN